MLITIPQMERYRMPTFDDLMNGVVNMDALKTYDESGSTTKEVSEVPAQFRGFFSMRDFEYKLDNLLIVTQDLRAVNLHTHYNRFAIPKRSGGLRWINAPDDNLMTAQRTLSAILSSAMPRTYHTNAFAYVKNRCTYDAVAKHQRWESHWFGHFDFKDFFGSTTKEFLLSQMAIQYPFALVKQEPRIWDKLSQALDICFLDGGLPQGTPISPLLTNIMMIPFDYTVTKALHSFPNRRSKQGVDRFIYTRYADDLHISCRVEFDIREIEKFLIETLREMNAPFTIKKEKTHYGSRSGSNWMLGYCLNKDNVISIGSENKRRIKAFIHSWACDHRNGILWDKDDLQVLMGKIQYWKYAEPKVVAGVFERLSQKYGFDLMETIKEDLCGEVHAETA